MVNTQQGPALPQSPYTQVNFLCNFNNTGIGRHCENAFFSLVRNRGAGILPIYVDQQREQAVARAVRASRADTDVTLFFWRFPVPFVHQLRGRKILWWFFESDHLPAKWLEELRPYDQIWAPSGWAREILLAHGVAPERVRVVESAINPDVFHPDASQRGDDFVFLSVGKYEKRKSIDETVQAFEAEFPLAEYPRVQLRLKADFPLFPERVRELAQRLAHDPRIRIVSGDFSDAQMAALYRSADAFVFPSKAEGFGLPLLEAIACGVPAITTNVSAQTAFLEKIPGLFAAVAYKPAPIDDADYRYFYAADYGNEPFGSWALPAVESIRRAMREMYEHPREWRERARRASDVLRASFSWDAVGRRALAEINALPSVPG